MPTCVLERPSGKWGAQIMVRGQMKWLGTCDTREQAQALVDRGRAKAKGQASKGVRRPPRRVSPPTVEDVGVMAAYMASRRPCLGPFIRVAAASGLRLSEVAALEWRDVQARGDQTWLHVRHGKGDRERWSVLAPDGVAALGELVSTRAKRQPLFVTAYGTLFNRKRINKYWQDMRDAHPELAVYLFHDLRKHHATWLLDRGVSDLDCAVQLGHVDRLGRPNPELVRRIYGFPSADEALLRVGAVMA